MFIVMHCGGMPFNGETILNKSLGGSETAAYYLAKELAAKGHDITIFTNSQEEGQWDGVKYRWTGNISNEMPLGERYHIYATSTPHDLNITQRSPLAFRIPVAAKVKAWWLHDLPSAHNLAEVNKNMVNVDLIFAVSEWHKQKIVDTWNINPENIISIENGIDLSLYYNETIPVLGQTYDSYFNILYSSRPERGLENLVKPNGIMSRLLEIDPSIHLHVCSYDNVTATFKEYYNWLYECCDKLSNVTVLGNLTKKQLANVQHQCDLYVYPTLFEETSCITAMEAMASGTPFLSSYIGALPETCENSGSILLPVIEGGTPSPGAMQLGAGSKSISIETFVEAVLSFKNAPEEERQMMVDTQQISAGKHTWDKVAERSLEAVDRVFNASLKRPGALMKHFMRNSDIYALKEFIDFRKNDSEMSSGIPLSVSRELEECYSFMNENDWSEHYRKYYEYEKERGINYGPENLDGNSRFEVVANIVSKLPEGSTVLDYGCAHGHYTINLAKRFPDKDFVGVDIALSNINKAEKWAEEEELTNVHFFEGQIKDGYINNGHFDSCINEFDTVIAAEVIEHVANPQFIVDGLRSYLKDHGSMVVTTPYGPWEAIGYEQHWPWRAHVHHFEREDLKDMFGHFDNFSMTVVSSGRIAQNEPIGSYVCVFNKSQGQCGDIDYMRKFMTQNPRQTLSVCMIAKDAENTIANTIKSISQVADEIVVCIDKDTGDGTEKVIKEAWQKYCRHATLALDKISSPLETGFDEARNRSISIATGDWIMWVDSDEIIDRAENIVHYLHNAHYQSIAVPHHHFSMEPAGLLKTDYPNRIFRNDLGIKFFGRIHEHPAIEMNDGIPYPIIISDTGIAHYGYQNEGIRRERFKRNWPLMQLDRKDYPDRYLGAFLYIRDLSMITQFELEDNGGFVTSEMLERAKEVFTLWKRLVHFAPLRLATESLEWYSVFTEIWGKGKKIEFVVRNENSQIEVSGLFLNDEHVNLLARRIFSKEI